MNRNEIMEYCPEEFEDQLKDIVDHLENKFNEIRDLLDITRIDELDRITEAFELAKDISSDLY